METDAARYPERFTGLIEHLEQFAGHCSHAQPPTVDGRNRGYALAVYQIPDSGPVTVISNGLRFQAVTASLEQELACTVHRDQVEAARYLVDIACELAIENQQGFEQDAILDNGQPLLAGTDITGVIVSKHPFFPEEFDLFTDNTDTVTLQILTLVPATAADIAFVANHGADALRELWKNHGTDVLDVERSAVIQ